MNCAVTVYYLDGTNESFLFPQEDLAQNSVNQVIQRGHYFYDRQSPQPQEKIYIPLNSIKKIVLSIIAAR
jgi:hypothetical protein